MDLNDFEKFPSIDSGGMYAAIQEMPSQLRAAYLLGGEFPFPIKSEISSVIIAGMGGSAIAGDLIRACFSTELSIPITIVREYSLPAWVQGSNVLVICSSHSGNTEETNAILEQSIVRGCQIVVITTGGRLLKKAEGAGIPVWQFIHSGQPRSAVGWSFGLLLHMFNRLQIIPPQAQKLNGAVHAMESLWKDNQAEIPAAKNPAKRLAGQLVNQYISIFAAEHLSPVARRWKTQINELAKAWCQFEILPEADHNTLAGVLQPQVLLQTVFTVFLQSNHYNVRNQKRTDLTFTEFMVAGIGMDKLNIQGKDRISEVWKAVLFGDLVAFYLAMYYDIDPTPVEAIESLKAQLT